MDELHRALAREITDWRRAYRVNIRQSDRVLDRLRALLAEVEAENNALRRIIDDHCGCLGSGARSI